MRSQIAAVALIVLSLSLANGTAKAASMEQVTKAIIEKTDLTSLNDLEESVRNEVICTALTQYHEARGSSEADLKAVGFSTRNRVRADIKHSFCKIIWEKGQYVWTKRPVSGIIPKEKSAWNRVLLLAREIVTNEDLDDPTHGADSFYLRKIHTPAWVHRSPFRLPIGAHIYVKMRGAFQQAAK